jgi:exosortase
VWERREALGATAEAGTAWGYVVLVAGIALLLFGEAAAFGYAARVSLLVVLAGLVLYLWGAVALRLLTFPIAYLLFMIPPPAVVMNQIAFPLQLMAARLATASLDALGIPVFREGNIIALAPVRLEVTEACSGIRSLVALLALGVIFAYLTQRSWWARVLLVLSTIPIALVTNAARITLTGVLVQVFGPTAGIGFYHEFSGLVIFGLAFVLLIVEGFLLNRMTPSVSPARAS